MNVGFDGLRTCVTACMCFFCRRNRQVPSQCDILDKVQNLSCRKAVARVITWGARRNDRPTQSVNFISRARETLRQKQATMSISCERMITKASRTASRCSCTSHQYCESYPAYIHPAFPLHHQHSLPQPLLPLPSQRVDTQSE